jgi:predicted nicotinamide N-methyase
MNLKVTSQTLTIGGREITLDLPADPEALLQEALDREATGSADGDPYWGVLWAASSQTAELLLRHPRPRLLKAMDVGCGVGLAGIAGLMAGLDMTFADHSSEAVRMAVMNASRNGFPNAKGSVFDWQTPPNDRYEFIFGSDILYDPCAHLPLLQTLQCMLTENGTVWIGDSGRASVPMFVDKALQRGWNIMLRDSEFAPVTSASHLQFRLIEMTRDSQKR